MADRIEKFREDCDKLVADRNAARMAAEVQRLCKWMQKHQDEAVPDKAKGQLLAVIQKYYQTAQSLAAPALTDSVTGLIEDLLKLPEGKLVTSKSKQQALKWLATLAPATGSASGASPSAAVEAGERWVVGDISDAGAFQLVPDGDGDEVIEGATAATTDLLAEVRRRFEEEGHCTVQVSRQGRKVTVTGICE
eukprot:GGOE01018671.1.p1 GENE.GGOE01018671.1~~GGOE01018671.1.p1  ORF type:complete len:193 (-),score=50.60 GGOE01018671.1:259-837(-)